MKKVIQIVLLILLIVLIFLFFNTYFFKKDKKVELENQSIENKNFETQTQNNLIKNLKYNVKFDDDSEYSIIAQTSELTYEENVEIVKMEIVKANLIDKNKIPLIIRSNKAKYNNFNYNTNFWDKVIIEYDDSIIISNNLDLDFNKNMIKIYNNVIYKGSKGIIKTDNVKIDLSTKNAEIFMDNSKNNVKIETN